MSRSISDTKVPTLIVSKYDLDDKYICIGEGDEGSVFNYEDKYALKTFALFRAMEWFYGEKVDLKFRKVEEMTKLHDESICFPLGILGFRDLFMEGCYYKLIESRRTRKNFSVLKNFLTLDELIDIFIKGDATLKRAHNMGLIVGDIKENNIIVDKNGNPIFVDVDNWAYGDYSFDFLPIRVDPDENKHFDGVSYKDNDIMLYTLMVLKIIFEEPDFNFKQTKEMLGILINTLDASREIKEYIQLLLSDAKDKPYVGPLLQKIREYNK